MDTATPPRSTIAERLYSYLAQLRDVRAVGLLFFLVIVLLISWSGVKTIETNYKLQKQIAEAEQQVHVQQMTNDNLRLENSYYQSNEYLELSARKNLGLAAPGETMVNVPKAAALARTIDRGNPDATQSKAAQAHKTRWQRNFEAWIDFLLHRQTNDA